MFKFLNRIEKLMGRQLSQKDLAFVHRGLPITELEWLGKFTELDTATLNRDGVEMAQSLVAGALTELGFSVSHMAGEARFGRLLVAERPGRRANFITLITHTDTVLGNRRQFTVDLSANRAQGSGVIDNKGGVVVGLSALNRLLSAYPQTEYGLRFVSSPNEEMGSIGFTSIFRELSTDTIVGFGLEPALENGSIIHQRRGNRWYDITIAGREAHAGRSYGDHGNAAHDLSLKIGRLIELTNYKKHLSVNVGHISGGMDKHNIICGKATAKLDVRFPSMDARESLHRKIEKIIAAPSDRDLCGHYPTEASFEIVDDCPPFSLTRRSKRLAREYAALISRLENRKVYSQPAGGAGDVNYLSTPKNFILDGLGPVGGAMHTIDEYLNVSSLESRAKALAGFLYHLQSADSIKL